MQIPKDDLTLLLSALAVMISLGLTAYVIVAVMAYTVAKIT